MDDGSMHESAWYKCTCWFALGIMIPEVNMRINVSSLFPTVHMEVRFLSPHNIWPLRISWWLSMSLRRSMAPSADYMWGMDAPWAHQRPSHMRLRAGT